jgi:hypothetical protein
MPTNKELQSVNDTEEFSLECLSFRLRFEEEIALSLFKEDYGLIVNVEVRFKEYQSPEYLACITEKKKIADLIFKANQNIQRNTLNAEELTPVQMVGVVERLSSEIKVIEDELLNQDDDNEEYLEEILSKMKDAMENLHVREANDRTNQISSFMKNAKTQRVKKTTKGDNAAKRERENLVFNTAKKDAEDKVVEILTLSDCEIAEMFSTPGNPIARKVGPITPSVQYISWTHAIKGFRNNVIPLSHGIQQPKKWDHTEKVLKDYSFTLTSFFKNPKFIQQMNVGYNKMGLSMSITQDKTQKSAWYIEIRMTGPSFTFC